MTNGVEQEDGGLKRIWKRTIYLPNGEFSITRFITIVSFFFSIALLVAGVLLQVIPDPKNAIVLSEQHYSYAFKVFGGSFGSYALTKIKDVFDKKYNNGNSTNSIGYEGN